MTSKDHAEELFHRLENGALRLVKNPEVLKSVMDTIVNYFDETSKTNQINDDIETFVKDIEKRMDAIEKQIQSLAGTGKVVINKAAMPEHDIEQEGFEGLEFYSISDNYLEYRAPYYSYNINVLKNIKHKYKLYEHEITSLYIRFRISISPYEYHKYSQNLINNKLKEVE